MVALSDRRVIIGSCILAAIFVAAAKAQQSGGPADLSYRGFQIDTSMARGVPNFSNVIASLRHQIDIVADCGAAPEILAFFRSQKITLHLGAGDGGGHFRPGQQGVSFDAIVQPSANPVLLHEMLHAYHFYELTEGVKNQEVLQFYARAKSIYPATEIHKSQRTLTYLLENEREFFAVTASTYLWGQVDREPHSRERLKALQPVYYAWLGRQFGVLK